MTDEDIRQSLAPITLCIPVTADFLDDARKVCMETDIKILEEHTMKNIIVLKLYMSSPYKLFQMGAFVQIERHLAELKQKGIDEIFKDHLS